MVACRLVCHFTISSVFNAQFDRLHCDSLNVILISGSNRVFGTVVEKKCIFLVDTSGSMDPYMDELKRELASLIWEQVHRNRIK